MNCGGRVYKGDTVTISVPFDVSGYTDLTISYSTTGDSKIVKGEDEVTIEDGFISYTFTGDELDLLPDGVIYYTINYEVDGTDYVASTNTNLYLKTPAGYSGKTAEEIYQDGYEAGLEACSGGTPCDCSSAYTEGYHDGYNQAQEECSGGTPCNLEEGSVTVTGRIGTYYPTSGYDGFGSVVVDASEYGEQMTAAGYEAGYNQGLEDCPECDCTSAVTEAYQEGFDEGFLSGASSTDCSSAVTEAYQEGYQSGVTDTFPIAYQSGYTQAMEDCSGSSCTLEEGLFMLTPDFSGTTIYPTTADGFSSVEIYDSAEGYWKKWYDEGYNDGLANCPECDCTSAVTEAFGEGYQSGATDTFPIAYQSGVTDTFPISYQSGFTDGYSSGISSCDSCVLETKTVELTAITQTIQAGNNARPVAPSGQTVYGGSIEEFEEYIHHGHGGGTGYQLLYYYEDVNHTTEIEIGQFLYSGVQGRGWYFADYVNINTSVYFNEMPKDEWVSACNGNLHFLNDGVNIWFYGDYKYGMAIRSTSHREMDINEMLFETVLYDGMKYVTTDASAIYNSGFTDGFASGQSSCDCSSAYTEGFSDGIIAASGTTPGNINSIYTQFSGEGVTQFTMGVANGRHLICSGYEFTYCINGMCYEVDGGDWHERTASVGLQGSFPVKNLNVQENGFSIQIHNTDLSVWGNDWEVKNVVFNGDIYPSNPNLEVEGGITLVPTRVTTTPYDETYTYVNIFFD